MTHNAKFWNRMAKRYAQMPIRDPASYQEKLTRTQAALPPHAQVLEIGCGTGSTALHHAPHVGTILAIDISDKMIDIAQQRAAVAGPQNVAFRKASLEDVRAEDGPFDGILALNLIHLLDTPGDAVKRMGALLKPGGVLVASTQCLADKMNWMRPIAPIFAAANVFPPLSFFSRADLERWITEAGMTVEDAWHPKGRGKAVFHIARKTG